MLRFLRSRVEFVIKFRLFEMWISPRFQYLSIGLSTLLENKIKCQLDPSEVEKYFDLMMSKRSVSELDIPQST